MSVARVASGNVTPIQRMGCSDGVMCDGVMPGAGGRPAQIQ